MLRRRCDRGEKVDKDGEMDRQSGGSVRAASRCRFARAGLLAERCRNQIMVFTAQRTV